MPDLMIRRGSREIITITFMVNGIPQDILGREVKMIRKDNEGHVDVFSTEDATPIIKITEPTSGKLIIEPDENTWPKSSTTTKYFIYFEIKEGDKFLYWPEAEDLTIVVKSDFGA